MPTPTTNPVNETVTAPTADVLPTPSEKKETPTVPKPATQTADKKTPAKKTLTAEEKKAKRNAAAKARRAAKKAEAAKKGDAPAEKKAPVAKNTTAKADKKTPAAKKTTAKKEVAKTETNTAGAPKATGLRKAQVRLLTALKGTMTRADWSKAAKVDNAACTEYVGSLKDEKREANDAKHFPSLLTLKLVKVKVEDVDGKNVPMYSLTAKGTKESAKLAAK